MAKKVGPYIGVTGFISRAAVNAALTYLPPDSMRHLMVGVLMSSKTLAGLPNKWPNRFPRREMVQYIFANDSRALNLVHYSTDQPETLHAQLTQITELAGSNLDGFQLNIAWPSLAQVESFREANPEKFLLLQIGSLAMVQAETLTVFARRLREYLPMIDAILIDPSGGRGEPFDVVKGSEYLHTVCGFPSLGLGIAGGLGPDTLDLLGSLPKEFPDLSIDAEGQLRTLKDEMWLDAVRIYIEDGLIVLAGKKLPGTRLRRSCSPYGFEGHLVNYGLGDNMLRTSRLVQPNALEVGDVLATGDKVLSRPRDAGNGGVFLHLTGGFDGAWVTVPGRIPIALFADDTPAEVRKFGER